MSAVTQIFYMALTKEQKKKRVEELEEQIAKQKAMVFVNFSGLKAKDLEMLREKLKQTGAKLIIVKKALANLAFKEKKIDFVKEEFPNELAIVFGFEDELAPAKAIYDFSKEKDDLKIAGGYLNNEKTGAEELVVLAQLPSKQELYGKLVGALSAPLANFVNVQRQNIKGLFYALGAIVGK